jgi:hypothetical protein
MSVCGAHSGCKLNVSGAGFYFSLTRGRSEHSRSDEELGAKVRVSFVASDRSYDAGRVWHDLIADGPACGLHRIERLMRLQGLRATTGCALQRSRLCASSGAISNGQKRVNMTLRALAQKTPRRITRNSKSPEYRHVL